MAFPAVLRSGLASPEHRAVALWAGPGATLVSCARWPTPVSPGGWGTGEHCGLSHRHLLVPVWASLGLRGSSLLREGNWEPERAGACSGSHSVFSEVHCLGLSPRCLSAIPANSSLCTYIHSVSQTNIKGSSVPFARVWVPSKGQAFVVGHLYTVHCLSPVKQQPQD